MADAPRRERTIVAIEARPLDVPLLAPFTIATSRLERVENVAIRIEIDSGAAGWGETPTLPPVTEEDQPLALATLEAISPRLLGRDASDWRAIARDLAEELPALGAVRAGIEMALIDALARDAGQSLHEWFGGAGDRVTTDITIPITDPGEAESLARRYAAQGFVTLKTKVGLDRIADLERLTAIHRGHPDAALVLDANEGFTAGEALALLDDLRGEGIEVALLEQPVARDDWEGLGRVRREADMPVAADESCRSAEDARRIASEDLATVLNIKLAKGGVAEALDIVEVAREAGLGLMIGGMVETRIAMGFAACFVAGLGGFDFVDLDTPLLLAEDPVRGGYRAEGPTYLLDGIEAGHGGSLEWD
jgi:L-alanine-DL-glutamate epimerase-like enolase superfamily enzyme